jgi:hypothetical protein
MIMPAGSIIAPRLCFHDIGMILERPISLSDPWVSRASCFLLLGEEANNYSLEIIGRASSPSGESIQEISWGR